MPAVVLVTKVTQFSLHLLPSIGIQLVPGYPCESCLLAVPPCIDCQSNIQIPVVLVEKFQCAQLADRRHEIHNCLYANIDRIDAIDLWSYESVQS